MNLRHAAALALVVWYMMLPPPEPGQNAPISRWFALHERKEINSQGPEYLVVLKSEQECKQKLAEELAYRKKHLTGCLICIHMFERGRCISSDDPRLDPAYSGIIPSN